MANSGNGGNKIQDFLNNAQGVDNTIQTSNGAPDKAQFQAINNGLKQMNDAIKDAVNKKQDVTSLLEVVTKLADELNKLDFTKNQGATQHQSDSLLKLADAMKSVVEAQKNIQDVMNSSTAFDQLTAKIKEQSQVLNDYSVITGKATKDAEDMTRNLAIAAQGLSNMTVSLQKGSPALSLADAYEKAVSPKQIEHINNQVQQQVDAFTKTLTDSFAKMGNNPTQLGHIAPQLEGVLDVIKQLKNTLGDGFSINTDELDKFSSWISGLKDKDAINVISMVIGQMSNLSHVLSNGPRDSWFQNIIEPMVLNGREVTKTIKDMTDTLSNGVDEINKISKDMYKSLKNAANDPGAIDNVKQNFDELMKAYQEQSKNITSGIAAAQSENNQRLVNHLKQELTSLNSTVSEAAKQTVHTSNAIAYRDGASQDVKDTSHNLSDQANVFYRQARTNVANAMVNAPVTSLDSYQFNQAVRNTVGSRTIHNLDRQIEHLDSAMSNTDLAYNNWYTSRDTKQFNSVFGGQENFNAIREKINTTHGHVHKSSQTFESAVKEMMSMLQDDNLDKETKQDFFRNTLREKARETLKGHADLSHIPDSINIKGKRWDELDSGTKEVLPIIRQMLQKSEKDSENIMRIVSEVAKMVGLSEGSYSTLSTINDDIKQQNQENQTDFMKAKLAQNNGGIGEAFSGISKALSPITGSATRVLGMLGAGDMLSPMSFIGGVLQQYQQFGRLRQQLATTQMAQAGSTTWSANDEQNFLHMQNGGINLSNSTNGVINNQQLLQNGLQLSQGLVGAYGESHGAAANDMSHFAMTNTLFGAAYGVSNQQMMQSENVLYKQLGMNVTDTTTALNQFAQEARSANIPVGDMLNTVSNLAGSLSTTGVNATMAANAIKDGLNHGMNLQNATAYAGAMGRGMYNFGMNPGMMAYTGMEYGGMSNPYAGIAAGIKMIDPSTGQVNQQGIDSVLPEMKGWFNYIKSVGNGNPDEQLYLLDQQAQQQFGLSSNQASVFAQRAMNGGIGSALDLFKSGGLLSSALSVSQNGSGSSTTGANQQYNNTAQNQLLSEIKNSSQYLDGIDKTFAAMKNAEAGTMVNNQPQLDRFTQGIANTVEKIGGDIVNLPWKSIDQGLSKLSGAIEGIAAVGIAMGILGRTFSVTNSSIRTLTRAIAALTEATVGEAEVSATSGGGFLSGLFGKGKKGSLVAGESEGVLSKLGDFGKMGVLFALPMLLSGGMSSILHSNKSVTVGGSSSGNGLNLSNLNSYLESAMQGLGNGGADPNQTLDTWALSDPGVANYISGGNSNSSTTNALFGGQGATFTPHGFGGVLGNHSTIDGIAMLMGSKYLGNRASKGLHTLLTHPSSPLKGLGAAAENGSKFARFGVKGLGLASSVAGKYIAPLAFLNSGLDVAGGISDMIGNGADRNWNGVRDMAGSAVSDAGFTGLGTLFGPEGTLVGMGLDGLDHVQNWMFHDGLVSQKVGNTIAGVKQSNVTNFQNLGLSHDMAMQAAHILQNNQSHLTGLNQKQQEQWVMQYMQNANQSSNKNATYLRNLTDSQATGNAIQQKIHDVNKQQLDQNINSATSLSDLKQIVGTTTYNQLQSIAQQEGVNSSNSQAMLSVLQQIATNSNLSPATKQPTVSTNNAGFTTQDLISGNSGASKYASQLTNLNSNESDIWQKAYGQASSQNMPGGEATYVQFANQAVNAYQNKQAMTNLLIGAAKNKVHTTSSSSMASMFEKADPNAFTNYSTYGAYAMPMSTGEEENQAANDILSHYSETILGEKWSPNSKLHKMISSSGLNNTQFAYYLAQTYGKNAMNGNFNTLVNNKALSGISGPANAQYGVSSSSSSSNSDPFGGQMNAARAAAFLHANSGASSSSSGSNSQSDTTASLNSTLNQLTTGNNSTVDYVSEFKKLSGKSDTYQNKVLDAWSILLEAQQNIQTLISNGFSELSMGGFSGGSSGGSGGAGSAGTVSGSGNSQAIWNFFAGKGLSSNAISGIMGNLQQESSLNPSAVNPSSGATGIAQWLGGRLTSLKAYEAAHPNMSPLTAQLNFMWQEMNGSEGTIKAAGGLSGLNSMSATQAANFFEKQYERAGSGADLSNRDSYANKFLSKFGGGNSGGSSSGGSSSSGSSNTASPSTVSTGAHNGTVTILQQDLNKLGYHLSVDGIFGPQTKSAVEAFQRKNNLSVDGIVGPQTWSALQQQISGGSSATGSNVTVTPDATSSSSTSPGGSYDASGGWVSGATPTFTDFNSLSPYTLHNNMSAMDTTVDMYHNSQGKMTIPSIAANQGHNGTWSNGQYNAAQIQHNLPNINVNVDTGGIEFSKQAADLIKQTVTTAVQSSVNEALKKLGPAVSVKFAQSTNSHYGNNH